MKIAGFGSFVPGGPCVLKLFSPGVAVAVLLDATSVQQDRPVTSVPGASRKE